MKKFIMFLMTFVCVLAFVGCDTKEQAAVETPNATIPSIMYEGNLYRTTEKQISVTVDESAIVGQINSLVPLSQLPSNDGEANFGQIGDPYALTADGLMVLVDNEWTLFELFEAESSSGASLEGKAFSTNRSYVYQSVPAYLNFYDDGTYEMVQFGTYQFDEKEGNKLIYLDFDEQEDTWAYSDAFVITDGENGSLQLIPAMLFFEQENHDQRLIESSIHLNYSSVIPTEQDGLKNGMSTFSGEYQFSNSELGAGSSLVFYKEGYFVQRIISEYKISKNNLITLYKTKYTYEENEQTGELSLKNMNDQSAGTYVKATADNGIHYVIPFDGYCYCDGGHKYVVVTSGVFENPSSSLIDENKLYVASLYTNDTDFSFADLNALIADLDTGKIPDLCDLTVTSSDGSASISLFQLND